jgi:hypothetical protein
LTGLNLISLVKVSYTQKEESFCLGVNSDRWKKNHEGIEHLVNVQQQCALDGFCLASKRFNCSESLREKKTIETKEKNKPKNYFDSQQLPTTFGRLTRIPQRAITTSYAQHNNTRHACIQNGHCVFSIFFFRKPNARKRANTVPG